MDLINIIPTQKVFYSKETTFGRKIKLLTLSWPNFEIRALKDRKYYISPSEDEFIDFNLFKATLHTLYTNGIPNTSLLMYTGVKLKQNR